MVRNLTEMICLMIENLAGEPLFMIFIDESDIHCFKIPETAHDFVVNEVQFEDGFPVEQALHEMQKLHGKLNLLRTLT